MERNMECEGFSQGVKMIQGELIERAMSSVWKLGE